jgi:hypothetical protein
MDVELFGGDAVVFVVILCMIVVVSVLVGLEVEAVTLIRGFRCVVSCSVVIAEETILFLFTSVSISIK